MKKRHLVLNIVLLACMISFTSCGKSDYASLIPRDAALVVSIEPQALLKEIGGTEGLPAFASQTDHVILKSLISAPQETGVDLSETLYLFASLNRDEPTLLMKLKKKATFEKWLDTFIKQGICDSIQSRGDFDWTFIHGQGYCAFTDELVLWVYSPIYFPAENSVLSRLSQLLQQKEQDSFVSTDSFRDLMKRKESVAFYFSMATFPNNEEISSLFGIPSSLSVEDLRIKGGMSLDKEKIGFTAQVYSENKELNDFLEEKSAEISPLSKEYIQYIPADAMACVALKIEEKFFSDLSSNPLKVALGTWIQFSGIDAEEFFSSIRGDFTVFVNYLENNPQKAVLACYTGTAGDQTREVLREGISNEGIFGSVIRQDSPDQYSLSKIGSEPIHFGVRPEGFYFTYGDIVPFVIPEKPLSETKLQGMKTPLLAYVMVNLPKMQKGNLMEMYDTQSMASFLNHLHTLELMVQPGNQIAVYAYFLPQ